MVERLVRNEKVRSSNLLCSTTLAAIHPVHFQKHTFQEALPVDIQPPAMDAGGDKMATISPVRSSQGLPDRKKKRGPIASVKFGSAVVPIYESRSQGRVRYCFAVETSGSPFPWHSRLSMNPSPCAQALVGIG